MEDLPFRPPFDMDKVPNAFLAANLAYPEALDQMKASLKLESLASPLRGNHEFRRHRLSSYEAPMFFPYKEEDFLAEMQGHVKTENVQQDFHSLAPQVHMDANFEMPMASKLQDYAIDYYRINRSRGPSFNLGPGRKNSEDIFAHGFDLLAYCGRNFDANDKMNGHESHDNRMHHDFLDGLTGAPMLPHSFPNALTSLIETNFPFGGALDNQMKDAMNSLTHNIQLTQAAQHHLLQQSAEAQQEVEPYSELEPKSQKKRKTNNNKEMAAPADDTPSNAQLKKAKSESAKKNNKAEDIAASPLKPSKSVMEKPSAKKSTAQKKGKKESTKSSDFLQVKSEVEDRTDKEEKSTEAGSINVSPNPKKEDLSALFPKSGIMGTFGTAQELLGVSLPAEVEEYINKSKIFNQIKAPIARKIGTLTLEERRIKIEKYLEKRKRRSWNKRVNYDCRKKVADNRLRIKGRFVTKDQAFGMLEALGIYPDPEKITNNEIKSLLTERFGAISNKKKDGEGDGADGKKSGKNVKVEGEDMSNVFGDFAGDQDDSEAGSQDDAGSESYL